MTEAPRIVAADLSITATGWADAYVGHFWTGLITTRPGAHGNDHFDKARRMAHITGSLCALIEDGPTPDLIAVEGPSYGSRGSAMFDLGGLWWLAYDRLHRYAPIAVISPSQRMLYATGKGAAKKEVVVDAFARRWPNIQTEADDNRIDAAVLALMALDHLGRAPVDMPKTHRAALDKVVWPEVTA